jgi:hypothetical protein
MKCKTRGGAEELILSMLKLCVERSKEWLQVTAAFKMEALKPPGLIPLKQVELLKKYGNAFCVHIWPNSFQNHLKKY